MKNTIIVYSVIFQHELKETEEKFRKAMILNAQLDNDKAALAYQLELLKDRIEELHEEYSQLQVTAELPRSRLCRDYGQLFDTFWLAR